MQIEAYSVLTRDGDIYFQWQASTQGPEKLKCNISQYTTMPTRERLKYSSSQSIKNLRNVCQIEYYAIHHKSRILKRSFKFYINFMDIFTWQPEPVDSSRWERLDRWRLILLPATACWTPSIRSSDHRRFDPGSSYYWWSPPEWGRCWRTLRMICCSYWKSWQAAGQGRVKTSRCCMPLG